MQTLVKKLRSDVPGFDFFKRNNYFLVNEENDIFSSYLAYDIHIYI